MIHLSKRMEAIVAMITPGNIVADVGTDHGYIPIALRQRNLTPYAYAMDLREGPLAHAKEHIRMCGLLESIETRLSDGVCALSRGEAETIVIAGMGGELVMHILKEGANVCNDAKELVLQPQSEIRAVRTFLRENGFCIVAENMVCEDGKYYPMMRVIPASKEECEKKAKEEAKHLEKLGTGLATEWKRLFLRDLYGPFLLAQKNPVLREYLKKENAQLHAILEGLEKQAPTETICIRLKEVEKKIEDNEIALHILNT